MSYITELLVDEFGSLSGGEDVFPLEAHEHDFVSPYPQFADVPALTWEPGAASERPNIFQHYAIGDMICDLTAWTVLQSVAGADLRLLGSGTLRSGETLYFVQVVTVLAGMVNIAQSSVKHYGSYDLVEFPTLRSHARSAVSSQMFRCEENVSDILVGEDVHDAIVAEGLTGVGFTPVRFDDQPAW